MKKVVSHLFKQIENNYGITKIDLQGERRYQELVMFRQFFSVYLRDEYSMSLKNIGIMLKRDHTTIINLIKRFDGHIEYDAKYANKYADFVYVIKKNSKDEKHTEALKVLELIERKKTINDRVDVIKKLISNGTKMV